MGYTKMNPQPAGLADGEVAILLDARDLVAVSASARWLANNGGLHIEARARWIEETGITRLCAHGQEVVTTASHNTGVAEAHRYGVATLTREALLLILGEPPSLMKCVPENGGGLSERPVLDVHDDVRTNCSIQHAISLIKQVYPSNTDVSTLLGLEGRGEVQGS
jgi:hypothetical protein